MTAIALLTTAPGAFLALSVLLGIVLRDVVTGRAKWRRT